MAGQSVVISILADSKGMAQGIDQINGKLGSIGGFAKKALGGLAAAFAVGKVVDFGKEIVGMASDAEQSLGAVQSVFKEYAGDVEKNAKKAAHSVGLSSNDYRDFAKTIGTQLKNAGTPMEEIAGKTDNLISLGADLASMFSGTTAEAVEALSSAFKGEMDPIERYGVNLKKSDINARLAAKGQDKLTGEALKQAEALALQELIMEQTTDAQGNFARESGDLAGKQQILSAKWANLKTQLGTYLLPVITAVFGFLSDTAMPIIEKMATWLGTKLGPVVEKVTGWIKGFGDESSTSSDLIKKVGTVLSEQVWPAFKQLGEKVIPLLEQVKETISAWVDGVVAAFNFFVDFFLDLWNDWGSSILEGITTALSGVISVFTGAFEVLEGIYTFFAGLFTGDWAKMWEGIQSILSGAWEIIKGLVETGWGLLQTIWNIAAGVLETAWSVLWDAIKAVASAAWEWIKKTVSGVWDSIKKTASSKWDQVKTAILRKWEEIKTGVKEKIDTLKTWAGNLPGEIKKKIGDVATTLKSKGTDLIKGMISGVKEKWTDLRDWLSERKQAVKDRFSSASTWLSSIGRSIISGLWTGLKEKWGEVKSWFGEITASIPSLKGPPAKDKALLKNAGRLVIGGFLDGMESEYGNVRRSLAGLTREVASTEFGSPSMTLDVSGSGHARPRQYVINVNVPPTADKASIGREIKSALDEWERVNGR